MRAEEAGDAGNVELPAELPRTRLMEMGPIEELLPGLQMPRFTRWDVTLPDLPDVDLEILTSFDDEKRIFEVTEVLLRTPHGAPELLRSIPLRSIAELALMPMLAMIAVNPERLYHFQKWGLMDPMSSFRHPSFSGRFHNLKERGPTDETLRYIATFYRVFRVLGAPPTKNIQDLFDLPRSTATRWVSLARKKGFLGKDEIGRGGGTPSRYSKGV